MRERIASLLAKMTGRAEPAVA